MTRRLVLTLAVLAVTLLAGCGGSGPHVWARAAHSRFFSACASRDCGTHAIRLQWSSLGFPGTTGYYLFVNGTQIASATASPYTFYGMDCGATFTLGVEAHDGSGNRSQLYTTPYTTAMCSASSLFPLQLSSNRRYLETANGSPWLMVGDSPQSVIGNLTEANADAYFTDRVSHGFNTLWINLLCDAYTGCNANGKNLDGSGVAPFTVGSSPSDYSFGTGQCGDCNPTYFADAHAIVADAKAHGIDVFVDPIETGGCRGGSWNATLANNGNGTISTSDADYGYGRYLGNEFKDLNNIVWISGNDFQCIETSTYNNNVITVADGIRSTDPSALQTLEADYCGSGGTACIGSTSLVDTHGVATGWSSIVNLNSAYVYSPTYGDVRAAYGQTPTMPAFLGEANYEGQNNGGDGCIAIRNCRLQEWWAMTSGATGQFYGGPCYAIRNSTVLSTCDTTAVAQLGYETSLLNGVAWSTLAPDANGAGHLVTSGGGTCPTMGLFRSVTCVTAASNPAGTLALIYLPDPRSLATITVDMSKFAGSVTARWFDPTSGTFTTVSGSRFANTGTHNFTPTGNNSVGDKDWALVLQAP